ncbi:very-long-chain aldehyde decarbonylase CER1-like [Rhododendron vialii]|uniref:very-long-chain aldehyde decarbonylase CER1-like n=1 Tax=Rhododendron vialii TaxID=182163 RepID=UPI00265E69E6|nr:very-long-chain aldehyde decarbonylase CER1-like [Rhododendron vialii]
MASKPGVLTDWPWTPLGSFKYVVLAPWVVHSVYSFATKNGSERDNVSILILPFLLWRAIHNQIWISISRHRTAKGSNRIVDKSIDFEQVDRESNWDDQILLNGLLFYIANIIVPGVSHLPIWRTDGVVLTALIHAGPVEFLYYWLHRALHHHYLYSRYHSHHHSSIVTEPITSVIHPFAEHISYFLLFLIPMVTAALTGTSSLAAAFGYITYIDLMNNMGHCNFELIPKWLFSIFPPLKYMMYTPSYHSLHHTQFRTNYSLFMPFYDYVYGTMDKSTDSLYKKTLEREEESPSVVHLTHLTTPESIYHLPIGFASFASKPQKSKWYLWLMWPVTFWSMFMTCLHGCTFVVERNTFGKLKLQSWAIPRYTIQFLFQWQREAISGLIEQAIIEAEARGTKVLSLGLLNQGEEINRNGEVYIQRYPQLKVKVVDGSSLVVAVVLNSIPKGTTQVLLRGSLSKVVYSIASALCQRGIQVSTFYKIEYERLKLSTGYGSDLVLSRSYSEKVWLVGDGLSEEEQQKAPKGTLFIPYSQFPPKKARNDCLYHHTPAMLAPSSLENLNSCENWLPRRAMSASRVAGIVHALEGWNVNECGQKMFDVEQVWEACLKHGFRPLMTPN